ncbi:MAG: hypothetical protein HQ519_08570 [Planctomycetes bacterium]|nr:hypothetical protein [Planctomycetota bacterium]
MKTRAVRNYSTPAYPTRLEALADSKLLEQNMPHSWRRRPEMTGIVCAFLALNACQQVEKDGSGASKNGQAEASIQGGVAPLFVHGEGRGATGCVVVAPPVFLSEEEALQVIREELKLHNIQLSKQMVALEGVLFTKKRESYSIDENDNFVEEVVDVEEPPVNFVLDSATEDLKIGVEFVSRKDYFDLSGPDSSSTVQGYDLLEVSECLSKSLGTLSGDRYYGVFYDPMEHAASYRNLGRSAYEQSKVDAKKRSKEMLKLQVKDFLDWLEAQGAL